jgi:hypothetical protein
MTETAPPIPPTAPSFVVLDFDMPDRPPLAEAGDHETALRMLETCQERFYDQVAANGEGGSRVRLALMLAPRDAAGRIGPTCHWAITNGIRPLRR